MASFLQLLAVIGWTGLARIAALVFVALQLVQTALAWRRLSHVPAPSWLANASYFWIARHTYSGRQYWVHRELHDKYGPLGRIGPNEVVTNDPRVLKKISGTDVRWARDSWYKTGKFNPYHENLLSRLDPKEHQQAKSRTIAAYSGHETPDLEVGVDDLVKILVTKIGTKYAASTAPLLDLGKTSCYFTLDVITRLTFGKEFGYLSEEKDHYNFLSSLHDLWPRMSTCADVPWIRRLLFSSTFLALFGPKPTDKAGFGALMGQVEACFHKTKLIGLISELCRVAAHYVRQRFSPNAKQRHDMLGSMIKHGLDQTECETEGLFMIIAGTESTASVIRSALIHTMTSPLVYQKLKKEIQLAEDENRVSNPITNQEAKQLPYLQAAVYESLRTRPPLIGFFPKVVPAGGETILGYYLPAGTAIGVNMSAMLRSKDLFGPDADMFRPERFMELDNSRRKQMERDVELAFGNGQWMCAGKTIAFMEINKSIFEMFRNFDLQLAQPYAPSDILTYGTFLENNLMVKVSKARGATAA